MRTTLDIDDDVLEAVRERAHADGKTTGQLVSELLRQALTTLKRPQALREVSPVYGFRPFPARDTVVTNAQVDALRDDDMY